jgi:hypothetical protein
MKVSLSFICLQSDIGNEIFVSECFLYLRHSIQNVVSRSLLGTLNELKECHMSLRAYIATVFQYDSTTWNILHFALMSTNFMDMKQLPQCEMVPCVASTVNTITLLWSQQDSYHSNLLENSHLSNLLHETALALSYLVSFSKHRTISIAKPLNGSVCSLWRAQIS